MQIEIIKAGLYLTEALILAEEAEKKAFDESKVKRDAFGMFAKNAGAAIDKAIKESAAAVSKSTGQAIDKLNTELSKFVSEAQVQRKRLGLIAELSSDMTKETETYKKKLSSVIKIYDPPLAERSKINDEILNAYKDYKEDNNFPLGAMLKFLEAKQHKVNKKFLIALREAAKVQDECSELYFDDKEVYGNDANVFTSSSLQDLDQRVKDLPKLKEMARKNNQKNIKSSSLHGWADDIEAEIKDYEKEASKNPTGTSQNAEAKKERKQREISRTSGKVDDFKKKESITVTEKEDNKEKWNNQIDVLVTEEVANLKEKLGEAENKIKDLDKQVKEKDKESRAIKEESREVAQRYREAVDSLNQHTYNLNKLLTSYESEFKDRIKL
jgi:hypothetical protein